MGNYRFISPSGTMLLVSLVVVVMVIIVVLGEVRGGEMAVIKKHERASCKRNQMSHK
jgi:hypothetical protein